MYGINPTSLSNLLCHGGLLFLPPSQDLAFNLQRCRIPEKPIMSATSSPDQPPPSHPSCTLSTRNQLHEVYSFCDPCYPTPPVDMGTRSITNHGPRVRDSELDSEQHLLPSLPSVCGAPISTTSLLPRLIPRPQHCKYQTTTSHSQIVSANASAHEDSVVPIRFTHERICVVNAKAPAPVPVPLPLSLLMI